MITASHKDLLIDWRLGERHFNAAIDGDLAANNGGWRTAQPVPMPRLIFVF